MSAGPVSRAELAALAPELEALSADAVIGLADEGDGGGGSGHEKVAVAFGGDPSGVRAAAGDVARASEALRKQLSLLTTILPPLAERLAARWEALLEPGHTRGGGGAGSSPLAPPPASPSIKAVYRRSAGSPASGSPLPDAEPGGATSAPFLPPQVSPHLQLMHVDARALAQHLVACDRVVYTAIGPHELYFAATLPARTAAGTTVDGGKAVGDGAVQRAALAPGVVTLNERFNAVVDVVVASVLAGESPRARADAIAHWIEAAR
ncbi:hypothetical protein HK405_015358, partial [Cladochytrium tenue]